MNFVEENLHLPFEETFHGILRANLGNTKIILPGVRLIVRNEANEYLLTRRSDNGQWVMPGGSVEFNESVVEAAARELFEETGLHALRMTLVAMYTGRKYHFINAHGGEHQMFSSVFWVSQYDGNILTDTDETTDCRFFTKSELPRDMPSVYRETINDLENYKGEVILK
jgi:8-oxo-dGTP pyrophosphatase MutT (NUDIX family)